MADRMEVVVCVCFSINWLFPIVHILSRSRDVHDQIRKLYKIVPNFAFFSLPIFIGKGPRFLDFQVSLSNRRRY